MSTESLTWLNRNVLVGFTAKRGNAWHWKASEQGDEPNHYTGAIPVGDVLRRLFAWHAIERPIFVGDFTEGQVQAADYKAVCADDTGDILGIFKQGYVPHQYDEWLLENVATLFDTSSTDLGIASAGLLKNRAVAWVQIETPESISTPEGVDFRPFFTAATSLNGDLSSTYQPGVQAVVCDNTLSAALGEKVQRLKIRHSKKSLGRITDAREALGIIFQVADLFSEQLTELCNWKVSTAEWQRLLDLSVPVPEKEGRGRTIAERKRESIDNLYRHDQRVTPWAGTAFGALQAFNTYAIHLAPVKGAQRAERVQYAALTGQIAKADAQVILDLSQVTDRQLVGV
jgi:phage/plasmid-like protein (TIGR03299 family)